MLKQILNKLPIEEVSAHCDIPCGIYDPYPAQIAAHTVVRMANLMAGLDKNDPEYDHKYSRYITIKEEHAELAKHEVRIIWGDFFNPGNIGDFPDVHTMVWDVMKKGSLARQHSSADHANALLESVLKFSEVFWKIKGKNTKRVSAPFPSGGELVLPEL
jgi:nickel superoxide dismutase